MNMTTSHLLTRHAEIQAWVTGKKGMPAIVRSPSSTGRIRAKLALRFGQSTGPGSPPKLDQDMSPVSWNAWLSEFDRQQLALKIVSDDEFELIERKNLN
jgi:hypothetical protein